VRLYLFLRSVVWTSVLSALAIIATIVSAFVAPDFAVPFGLSAIALAVLSPRRSEF
jgi:hypothetical protein